MKSANIILIGLVTLISACAHSPIALRSATPEELKKESNSHLCQAYASHFVLNKGEVSSTVRDELARRGIVPVQDQAFMDNINETRAPDGAAESTLFCKIRTTSMDKFAIERLDSDPMLNKAGKRQYKRSVCKVNGPCADLIYYVVDGKIATSIATSAAK
jgi:hypothetical protein